MLRARERDFFRLAVVARVVGAHRALQLGEFADHVGEQVGLRKTRGAARERGIDADHRGDFARERFETLHAFERGAELVVIDHVCKQRHALFEALLLVLREEELRICETRTHHALVAFDNLGGRLRIDIGHDQETRAQLAVLVREREILLVRLHREDQTFLRHLQELLVEAALIHDRPFDERVHFVEQRLRHHDAVFTGERLQLRADGFAAVIEIRDDMRLRAQRFRVVVGARNGDETLRQKAMADGRIARIDAERAHRHDVAAVHGDKALHRTHELHVGAVRTLIRHDLRDRQLGERFVERGLQAVGERRAGRGIAQEERLGLAVLRAFEFGEREVGEAQRGEFLRERRRGIAFLVERDRDRQHFFADLLLGRDIAHVADQHGKAAGRRILFERYGAFDQIAGGEPLDDAFGERGAETREGFRREFFGEQLDEQGSVIGLRHCSVLPRQT